MTLSLRRIFTLFTTLSANPFDCRLFALDVDIFKEGLKLGSELGSFVVPHLARESIGEAEEFEL